MVFFALLFALFFLIFWISFPQNRLPGLLSISLALLTGVGVALIRYLACAEPRFHDFGWSLYGTALLFFLLPPVVLPSAVFVLLRRLRVLPPVLAEREESGGWVAWLLLANIPYCAIFALVSPEPGTVKQLVLLPVLWIVQIITIHFFVIRVMGAVNGLLRVLFTVAVLAVPFLCAAVYRAWVAKELFESLLFLMPLIVVFVLYFLRYFRAKA